MTPFNDFAFESTGDAAEDEKLAAAIRRQRGHDAEGLCWNGCGPMEQQEPGVETCPVCHFILMRRAL